MKLPQLFSLAAALAGLALPLSAQARDHDHHSDHRSDHRSDRGHYDGRHYDRGRGHSYYGNSYYGRSYFGYPRYYGYGGYGYGGYGYGYGYPYYRPSLSLSYYNSPSVYRGRSYGSSSDSLAVDVQRELRERGYYHGSIDGSIGSGSRAAIRGYQRDRGLAITGRIDSTLLRSLGVG